MDRKDNKNRAGSQVILLVSLFALVLAGRVFAAGVEVDGATHTTLDTAPNGIPVVNIATPNSQGLSHNNYVQLNVSNTGELLFHRIA